VVAQEPNRSVAIINRALSETFARNLADVALSRPQYVHPFREQHRGRKRCVAGSLEPDELRDIFEILAENVL
jgi:hypothetical protein